MVFVNVQVIDSPASRSIVAVLPDIVVPPSGSEHDNVVAKPATAVSATVYEPGATLLNV
jgi:hypothetical protein